MKFLNLIQEVQAQVIPASGPIAQKIQNGSVNLDDFGAIFVYSIEWLLGLAPSIGVLMIMYGGVLYMIGGVTDNNEQGKQAITYAVVGLIVALLSWFVVDMLQQFLTNGSV